MVKLTVENGVIKTRMVQQGRTPIYEEMGQGIVELLTEFQAELICKGNSREKVNAAFMEIMVTILCNNSQKVDQRVLEKSKISTNGLNN